ncbi:MAG: hypothetical protein KatS3mg109_1298 [Pirellulaceae bacterium]|nr:MAG: hypothetical protein KatS3mg109_1298 [Pirellulaceae bacterium]
MDRVALRRRGVTLLELLVVVTLIGIFAAVAAARYGRSFFGDFGAQGAARRLALELSRAQRLAITTGDNHFVELRQSDGRAGYRLMRRSPSGTAPVDNPHWFDKEVTVRSSDTELEFTFEGEALGAYRVQLSGANRQFRVLVTPVSGAVRIEQP